MQDFNKAVSYDLQGSQVLLQHIGNFETLWKHSSTSIRRRRRQLYAGELRPRLGKDLQRVERLIVFMDTEVHVFCNRPSHSPQHDNRMTVVLLKQLKEALQRLLDQIDSLPKERNLDAETCRCALEGGSRGTYQAGQELIVARHKQVSRDGLKKRARFGGDLQAQMVSLLKPDQAPALVVQSRHARYVYDQPHCHCEEKPPSPDLRVDSAMSIR